MSKEFEQCPERWHGENVIWNCHLEKGHKGLHHYTKDQYGQTMLWGNEERLLQANQGLNSVQAYSCPHCKAFLLEDFMCWACGGDIQEPPAS